MNESFGSHLKIFGRLLNRLNLKLRPKLIIIFLVAKVIPITILTMIAFMQISSLGHILRNIAVEDSSKALNDGARENIERITTDVAARIADFLRYRNQDVLLLSKLTPSDATYKDFSEARNGMLVRPGQWVLDDTKTFWVEKDPYVYEGPKEVSVNKENNDIIYESTFRYRPPEFMCKYHEYVPLYDEVAFIDLKGNQLYKYVNPKSAKKNYPFNPNKVDVSNKANTYIKAEDYFDKLKNLQPGEIYVSDVIGAYVGTNYIGMYTPKILKEKVPETHPNYALLLEIASLPEEEFVEKAKQQAYAGKENPVGQRFEGIVRFATPVTDKNGEITGYVTVALNHDHIMEFVDYITPMYERYVSLPSAFEGNYAFIWDYKSRNIAHPRHHSIVGYNPLTGEPQVPWLEGTIDYKRDYKNGGFIKDLNGQKIPILDSDEQTKPSKDSPYYYWYSNGGAEWLAANPAWNNLSDTAAGTSWGEFLAKNEEKRDILPQFGERILKDKDGNSSRDAKGNYIFDYQSRDKTPAAALTKAGFVALDGRYLNNAPQCTGWMNLTENGGSGSFYILWSGLYKPTTAGAIPYYTGQYAPKNRNGSKRGFAFVTIGAGIEDFTKPARETEIAFTNTINANMTKSILQLGSAAMILFLMVIFVAILFSSYLTDNIKLLIKGISRFRSGEWQFRLRSDIKDEFGTLANSFDDMADSIENSVNEPISIIDMNYKVIYMNSCTLSVINKTLDEVIGVAYDNVSIYPNGSKYDPIAALHEDREAQIYYMSDNKRYYKGTANYIVDQNGKKNGYIIMTNDITIIEEARKNAEQASHAKSDFLARMSHEIRTPMNAIIGMASIALNKDMPAPIREHLQTIKGAGTNLLSIINDILDISKIESGKIEIIPKDYLFSSLINDVVSIVRTKIVDSKIRFDLNIDGDIPNALFGDEARIRQVLLNVLGNAAKYTKEGFIYLYVSGKRVKDTLHLVISVADSGVGIKQEDISKLFKSFARVDLKANIGIEGTGLGLAITKSLVNAMGGNISVESEYGKGSTFTITLPQKIRSLKSLNDADSAEKDNNFVIKFNAPKAKVLVVDDLNTNLKIAEGLMEPYRMQVDSCLSGQKAIDLIMKSDTEKRLYDVVFMDHMMPEMDGVEATKHIRGQGYDFPIIALTANAVSGAKEMFLENGFNDFLSKPIDMAELNAVLKKWLPKEKQEDANHTVQAFKLDFSLRMLAVLNKDLVSKMAEIEKCLESEDYHLYTVHVHGIKSATASIGAKEISELAKTLEAAGKEKNAEFIKLNTPKFMADLQGLIDSINMRFKGNPEKKALDSGAFVKLKKLKEALKDFDTDVIDEALDYLLDFERTEGILQNVLANNYDNAITMIENLRS